MFERGADFNPTENLWDVLEGERNIKAVESRYLSGAQLRIGVFELVPDGFEDGGKGSDTDAGADQHADLIVEHILAGCPERSIHTQSEGKPERNFLPMAIFSLK